MTNPGAGIKINRFEWKYLKRFRICLVGSDKMIERIPEFQLVLKVEFDGDINVEYISDILKMKPTLCQTYHEAGYTKINHEKLPAAWWYSYPSPCEFQPGWKLNEQIEEFFQRFSSDSLTLLSDFVKQNHGSIALTINIYYNNGHVPEMCIYGRAKDWLYRLNADIMININEEND